jgi:hypothetical protein
MAGGDYAYVLMTGSLSKPTAIAKSNAVAFSNPNEPVGPRLAMAGDATSMRVTWNSALNTGNPRVSFQPATGGSPTVVPATSYTYTAADMCGAPANSTGYRSIGWIHTAVMTGLVPGSRYNYTVGDDSEMTPLTTFTQPPSGFPFYINAVGDMGQLTTDGSQESDPFAPAPNTTGYALRDVVDGRSNLFLHVGDISYARGYAVHWFQYFHNLRFAAQIPYMLNQGNHERDYANSGAYLNGTDSGGECGVPATQLFPMPGLPIPPPLPSATKKGLRGGQMNLFWAEQMGPLYTVHFSTELFFQTGSDQWTFVRNALAKVDRSVTPFVVVGFHRPMYISSTNVDPISGDQPVAELLRQHVEPLLQNVGGQPVDLVLQGHHHSYQRTCAVNNMTCVTRPSGPDNVYRNPGAPIHLVIGTGGAGFSTNVLSPQPPQFEVVQFWHGLGRITLHNSSTLEWNFINDLDGSVADSFWIVKD